MLIMTIFFCFSLWCEYNQHWFVFHLLFVYLCSFFSFLSVLCYIDICLKQYFLHFLYSLFCSYFRGSAQVFIYFLFLCGIWNLLFLLNWIGFLQFVARLENSNYLESCKLSKVENAAFLHNKKENEVHFVLSIVTTHINSMFYG